MPGLRILTQGRSGSFTSRLTYDDLKVATVNSSMELAPGPSSKHKPAVTRALTVLRAVRYALSARDAAAQLWYKTTMRG